MLAPIWTASTGLPGWRISARFGFGIYPAGIQFGTYYIGCFPIRDLEIRFAESPKLYPKCL